MFSYFQKGINDVTPKKTLDLSSLVKIIKNNPNQDLIKEIRQLRIDGKEYLTEKRQLPNITPNCIVSYRKLKEEIDFEKNFIDFSQYIYIDIDGVLNVKKYKEYFIKKYGHLVSLVSISSSMGGLCILIKVSNEITKYNFSEIRSAIISTYFTDEIEYIDSNCLDIGRAMYISYDPDVYYNYENEITVSLNDNIVPQNKKGIKQPISDGEEYNNRLNDTFYKIIPIDEVINKICLRTSININKPVVEIIPIDFTEVTFPKKILDNNKHRIFTGMIHSLVNLNPDQEPDYLFSYINFINNQFAYPSMNFKKLVGLFSFVYNSIKDDKDYNYSKKRVKWIHFNKQSLLTGDEKKGIAANLNGKRRTNGSIEKIQLAKKYLESIGQKITQKLVAELTSLSIATVKRHFHKAPIDLNKLINEFNDTFPPRTQGICFKDRLSSFGSVNNRQ